MEAKSEDWKELRDLLRNAALNDWGADGEVLEWRDKRGKGISAHFLKSVLKAIAEYGPRAFPSQKLLVKDTGIRGRTIQRAIEILQAKDVLAVHQERTPRGHKRNFYTILRPKLRLLAQDERLPILKPTTVQRTGQPGELRTAFPDESPELAEAFALTPAGALCGAKTHAPPNPPAAGSCQAPRTPTHAPPEQTHAPPGTNPCATRSKTHAPPGGAITSDVERQREVFKKTSDVGGAGRFFSPEDRGEIKRLANELSAAMPAPAGSSPLPTPADRALVLKVATLRHDGRLSEYAFADLVGAYKAYREKREPAGIGLIWQVLREKCRQAGGQSFEQLLTTTEFPRDLLDPPPRPAG